MIKLPRVAPIPMPTRSAVERPVDEALIALGTMIVEEVGIPDEKLEVKGPEAIKLGIDNVVVDESDDCPEDALEIDGGAVVEVLVVVAGAGGCVVWLLTVDCVAGDDRVPLCSAEHTLKAFCLAVGTASTPVQTPSLI